MRPILKGSAAVRQFIAKMKASPFLMQMRSVSLSQPIPTIWHFGGMRSILKGSAAVRHFITKMKVSCFLMHAPRAGAK